MNAPFSTSKYVARRFSGERFAITASYARFDAVRYFGSPVSRESSPNSRMLLPISARFIGGSRTAPVRRFAYRYGAPVGDFAKHGSTRSAASRARSSNIRSPVAA